MKKLMIALFMFTGMAFGQQANAQVRINVNLGNQPAWGPSGYSQADFYYMPAINSYYDVSCGQYVYLEGTRWIYGRQLPPRYRGFDMYRSYKVVMNQPTPFRYNRNHIAQYGRYRDNYNQPMNRDNRDYRNYGNNGHYRNGNGPGYAYNGNRGGDRGQGNNRGNYGNGGYRGQGHNDGGQNRGGDRGHNDGNRNERGNGRH